MPRYTDHAESSAAWYHPGADDGEMSQEHQTDFAGFNISYDNITRRTAKRTASCQNLSTLA